MEQQNNASSSTKSPVHLGWAVIAILIVVVIGYSLMNQKSTTAEKSMETDPVASTTTPTQPEVMASEPVNGEIMVEAGSFYFKPDVIKLKKGQKVKITFNSVSMMHDFVVDELMLKIPVTKSGSSATVEFTPEKVGEFEYYCSVGQHRANGQKGRLIVTD